MSNDIQLVIFTIYIGNLLCFMGICSDHFHWFFEVFFTWPSKLCLGKFSLEDFHKAMRACMIMN